MRSFLFSSASLFLALASISQAKTGDVQAVKYGRSESNFVDGRAIDAALEVLRRANYSIEDHIAKRDDSFKMKEEGSICYCRPAHPKHTAKPVHHGKKPSAPSHPKPVNHKPSDQAPPSDSDDDEDCDDDTPASSSPSPKPTDKPASTPKPTHKSADKEPAPTPTSTHKSSHHHHSSEKSTSTTSTHASKPSGCPSGYKSANEGDVLVYNDNDLIDVKDLTVSLNILSFSNSNASPSKSTEPAKDSPKCKSKHCCYKPDGDKHQCPSGYKSAKRGDVLIKNDNDLIDAKDLSVSLNILSFAKPDAFPATSSKSAKSSPKCEDEYCCYKPKSDGKKHQCPSGYKSASRGDVLVDNDNDLIDAKDISISLDILSFSKPDASPSKSSKSAKSSPKCKDEYCCYKANKGKKGKASCPAGYTTYSQGETIVKNDNDLVDLKDLDISINILSFPKPDAEPKKTTSSPKDKPVCKDETCCVKQTSKHGGKEISNDNDLVDAKGLNVSVCLLSLCI